MQSQSSLTVILILGKVISGCCLDAHICKFYSKTVIQHNISFIVEVDCVLYIYNQRPNK